MENTGTGMKRLFLRLLLPVVYASEPSTRQSEVKTSNGLAMMLCVASLVGIIINFVIANYQRVYMYLSLYPFLILVIYLNAIQRDKLARVLLAFFPGVFLLVVPLLAGGVVQGDRQSYFLVVFMYAIFPLMLFSDSCEKIGFYIGMLFYATFLAIMDDVIRFSEVSYERLAWDTKVKEVAFYGLISLGFALKLEFKSQVEKELKDKNRSLSQQKDEIEVLLEEVRTQKEELFVQQETLYVQNDQLEKQRDELAAINERLNKNNAALLDLASERILTDGNYDEALKLITQIAAQTLNVSRVSIWEIERKRDSIRCMDMYSLSSGQHSCGMELFSLDFPTYFEAIKANKTIVADDAGSNVFTSEFKDKYLIPMQIVSMLDSPFFEGGYLRGIICFEQQNFARTWTQEDIIFSRAIADLIPLAFECAQRKGAQDQILAQNDLLLVKQQEILQLNEHLEEKVKKRTQELESRNKVLEEYAFYNAHVLRAPLCSLQGLVALATKDNHFIIDDQYLYHLKKALLEMEKITEEVSEKLRFVDNIAASKT